jgi:hypothetical protein
MEAGEKERGKPAWPLPPARRPFAINPSLSQDTHPDPAFLRIELLCFEYLGISDMGGGGFTRGGVVQSRVHAFHATNPQRALSLL